MKYKQTDKIFLLNIFGEEYKVRPINGEEIGNNSPSWSHGLTHFIFETDDPDDPDTWPYEYPDGVGFCGQEWFERNAKELT